MKNTRFFVIYVMVGGFFALIFSRLFYLQAMCGQEAQKTITQMLSLTSRDPAERGRITDRNGVVLAGNRKGYIILIEKGEDSFVAVTAKNLSSLKNITYQELLKDMQDKDFSYNNPYVFSEDAQSDWVTKIKEAPEKYPCAKIITQPIRQYFYPQTAVHLLGRCGIISAEEYASHKNYSKDDYIGKQGAEKAFEDILRGKDGVRAKEKYTSKGIMTFRENIAPIPGQDVALTIDLTLQQATEQALQSAVDNTYGAKGGACVAMDVNTGEILSLASNPTYNITEFNEKYTELLNNPNKPFFNRCIQGLYEPGSTFKPITAIAAMESGTLFPEETIKTLGKYEYFDRIFRCNIFREKGKTHGTIDVKEALGVSCNYFFYELGHRTGIKTIGNYAHLFGLDRPTGIELTEEITGIVATPELRKSKGTSWYAGDTLQAAIGQSDNLFTPLALCNYTAALGNGGTLYQAHILKEIKTFDEQTEKTSPKILNTLDISPKTMQTIKEGMLYVTKHGTAKDVFSDFPVTVAGKTGTSQIANHNNGLFIGYAPAENPQIAVCTIIEGGGSGNIAATVAKDILSCYFNIERITE